MGVYIFYYPVSDNHNRIGIDVWPELLRCLREVNEKDFKTLLNLPENGIIDTDQVTELVEAFNNNEAMIFDWLYNLPEDYQFDDSLTLALWEFVARLKDMNDNCPGLIQIDVPRAIRSAELRRPQK